MLFIQIQHLECTGECGVFDFRETIVTVKNTIQLLAGKGNLENDY